MCALKICTTVQDLISHTYNSCKHDIKMSKTPYNYLWLCNLTCSLWLKLSLNSVQANHPDRSNQLPIFGKQVQQARAAHMNQAELIASPSIPVYSMNNQTVLVPSIGYFAIFLSFFLRKPKTFNINWIEHIKKALMLLFNFFKIALTAVQATHLWD